jgi:hypothetical protein
MDAPRLTIRQDLVFKVFATVAAKYEIGKLTAKEVEQVVSLSEIVADRILSKKEK